MFWKIAPFLLFTSLYAVETSPLLTEWAPPMTYEGKVNIVTGRFYDEQCDLLLEGASHLKWSREISSERTGLQLFAVDWAMAASSGECNPQWAFDSAPARVKESSQPNHLPAEANQYGIALVELGSPDELDWIRTCPNGNVLTYIHDKQMRLKEIACHNSSGKKLGLFEFKYDEEGYGFTLTGNEEQKLRYVIGPRHQLAAVTLNDELLCAYEYGAEGLFRYLDGDLPLNVVRRTLRAGDTHNFDYYAAGENGVGNRIIYLEGRLPYTGRNKRCDHPTTGRVKELSALVDPKKGSRQAIAYFFYDYNFLREGGAAFKGGSTDVVEFDGNRIHYEYDEDGIVRRRSYYNGEESLLCSEEYQLDFCDGLKVRKIVYDGANSPIAVIKLRFDKQLNLLEKETWGQLTSHHAPQLSYGRGGVETTGVESHRVTYIYEPCGGKNLRCACEVGDFVRCDYTYLNSTNLVTSALLSANGRVFHRRFVVYNEDGMPIEEIEDDGSGLAKEDLTGVTARTIKRSNLEEIGLKSGLPKKIDWLVWDFDLGLERLVQRISYVYNDGGQIIKKTTLNYQGQTETIETKYDDKSRNKISETISVGVDEARIVKGVTQFVWDEKSNLLKETTETNADQNRSYTYDAMGRLTKIEKPTKEGVVVMSQMRYDYRGRCIEEIYEDGTTIHSTYGPLNRLVKQSTALGNRVEEVQYEYNALGYPICEKRKVTTKGQTKEEDQEQKSEVIRKFNIRGQMTLEISEEGGCQEFEYDRSGRLFSLNGVPVESDSLPISDQAWSWTEESAPADDKEAWYREVVGDPAPPTEAEKGAKKANKVTGQAGSSGSSGGTGGEALKADGKAKAEPANDAPQRKTSEPSPGKSRRSKGLVGTEVIELRLDEPSQLLAEEEPLAEETEESTLV
jgi:YD repeat-containing protein